MRIDLRHELECPSLFARWSALGYKQPSAVSANYVRSYPKSGRELRHLFTAAVDPKRTLPFVYPELVRTGGRGLAQHITLEQIQSRFARFIWACMCPARTLDQPVYCPMADRVCNIFLASVLIAIPAHSTFFALQSMDMQQARVELGQCRTFGVGLI